MTNWELLDVKNNTVVYRDTEKPFTGTVCHESHVTIYLDFIDGIENGEFIQKNNVLSINTETGETKESVLTTKGFLKNGEFIDNPTTFREDGTISSKGKYKIHKCFNDLRLEQIGDVYEYDKDGRIVGKNSISDNNHQNESKQESFYDNGKTSRISIERKDSSIVKTYHKKTGDIKSYTEYKDDTQHGLHRTYYLNGNKKSEGFYREGKKDGKWTYYYENGNFKTEGSYDSFYSENNEGKEGSWKYYNEYGQLIEITEYSCGRKHGISKTLQSNYEWNEVIYHRGISKGKNNYMNRLRYNILYQ